MSELLKHCEVWCERSASTSVACVGGLRQTPLVLMVVIEGTMLVEKTLKTMMRLEMMVLENYSSATVAHLQCVLVYRENNCEFSVKMTDMLVVG